jgi:hypothetical protein
MGVAACGPGDDSPADNPDAGPPSDLPDEDGDTIADEHEGRSENVDTDGDGTPDYLDDDSDGDGIPDYREAGDTLSGTPPLDSDSDGIPDFQDTDSDDNGRPDGVDGVEDFDGDGKPNFADLDDDNDTLLDVFEIRGSPDNPPDTNNDGMPDFQDIDSDGDTILDQHERAVDPDGDNLGAYIDLDADGDCIPDAMEAGDADPQTFPRDFDGDGRPDYIDLDSDNDGLPDGDEDANCNGTVDTGETSPIDEDSDNDGVTDLVEVVAGTDPNNGSDNPLANGDFFFIVPYQMPTTPVDDTLEFRTSIQFADLYFNFDTTGSMDAELASMRNATTGVPAIISQLTCAPTGGTCMLDNDCAAGICFNNTCVTDPSVGNGCIPDLWTGVGVFNNVNTYRNLVSLQSNPTTTANAIPGTGGGASEAVAQAAACVANPSRCTNTNKNCAASGVGCPGFRANAVRILVHISDANDQCGSSASCISYTQAGQDLLAQQVKFIGLFGTGDSTGTGDPRTLMEQIGLAAQSFIAGTPNQYFVYPAVDAAVVTQTRDAVLQLARDLPLDVTIDQADEPNDDGDSLQFIDYLEVNISGTGNCTNVATTTDTNADGYNDAFPGLRPGTPVCWDVHPIPMNGSVPATESPQLFIARLTVYGDGSPLDSRQVFFLIPPIIDNVPID